MFYLWISQFSPSKNVKVENLGHGTPNLEAPLFQNVLNPKWYTVNWLFLKTKSYSLDRELTPSVTPQSKNPKTI